jgi:L-fuculose-phosphate aldolase
MSGGALQREREDLVAYGRRMASDRLAIGTGGNLSCRVGDVVAITPRGVGYDVMEPGHICLVTLDGDPIDPLLGPSSELPMHLSVYERSDAAAVVHTHSEYATILGTLIEELPPIHYLISLLGGPVRVAPYATPGSAELTDHMAKALQGRSAVLLGNHGTITTGETLDQAYSRALLLEWLCGLYYRARLFGDPRLLDEEEIDKVARQLQHYLQDPR